MSKHIYDKFNKSVMQAIIYAKAASIEAKVDALYPESLAIGILTTGSNEVNSTLIEMDADLEVSLKILKGCLAKKIKQNKKLSEKEPSYTELHRSKQIVEIFRLSSRISQESGGDKITLSHVFVAMLRVSKVVLKVFEDQNLDSEEIEGRLKRIKETATRAPEDKKKKGALESFCIDITEQAMNNELDPIIAREKEIEDAITILCRRNKNNPVLLGEPGVGKTAVVEGIAQRIVSGVVPKQLRGFKVYSLNLGGMVSGTKYRGDFEERIESLINEIEKSSNVILFIDEIHTIIGAGGGTGTLDASNILKPFLTKNKVKCVGATTLREYKKYFEKDGALERRFQQIIVEEPTKEQVSQILGGVKERLEEYHSCKIEDGALKAVVDLTGQYMSNRNFPDKAIDCLDLACAKYAWDYTNNVPSITKEDIQKVISERCKIPLEIITCKSTKRVDQIGEMMSHRVMGQDHAIASVCRTLKNAYSGVRDPSRPIGNFIFGGQSGTGKTQTAKELASAVFGRETDLIRLDMTEFSEAHSISKLIGSPPGYVGHSETDVFVDKVRRNPYCIVLLDEVEKAHEQVVKVFLQVMSDGTMTDTSGTTVDFKNVIFIMTGNFGLDEVSAKSVGFADKEGSGKTLMDIERDRIIAYCREKYGTEFINRVDEFIPFMPLKDVSLRKISQILLKEINDRIDVKITFTKKVYDKIVTLSKDQHGKNANPIKRIISNEIEPCIANAILSTPDIGSKAITISVKDDEFISTIKNATGKKKTPSKVKR